MIDEKKLMKEVRYLKSVIRHNPAIDEIVKLIKQQEVVGEWIPVSERLPKNEEEVEITCTRERYLTGEKIYFTARAFYEDGTMNTEDSSYCWYDTDNWEYDEERDAYIIPESWFETVWFNEELGHVDAKVIAWRPLSEPYKEDKEIGGDSDGQKDFKAISSAEARAREAGEKD